MLRRANSDININAFLVNKLENSNLSNSLPDLTVDATKKSPSALEHLNSFKFTRSSAATKGTSSLLSHNSVRSEISSISSGLVPYPSNVKSIGIGVIIGNRWSIFKEENATPMLPQETEAAICSWLLEICRRLELLNNPKKMYGNIVFSKSGRICDFEISMLTETMLMPGWNRWLNTLASGEILLDIINAILSMVADDEEELACIPEEVKKLRFRVGFPVKRITSAFPGIRAMYVFLLNHYTIMNSFLHPHLEEHDKEHLLKKLQEISHYKYTLLNSGENTKLETWMNFMVVVMAIMSVFGCLTTPMQNQLKSLLDCLTDETLDVPTLAYVYRMMINKTRHIVGDRVMGTHDIVFPYNRILRQGFF